MCFCLVYKICYVLIYTFCFGLFSKVCRCLICKVCCGFVYKVFLWSGIQSLLWSCLQSLLSCIQFPLNMFRCENYILRCFRVARRNACSSSGKVSSVIARSRKKYGTGLQVFVRICDTLRDSSVVITYGQTNVVKPRKSFLQGFVRTRRYSIGRSYPMHIQCIIRL